MSKLNQLIDQNTHYIFMAIAVLFLVMALANFAGVPWVVKPRGGNDKWLHNKSEITSSDLRLQAYQTLSAFNPEAAFFYRTYKQII